MQAHAAARAAETRRAVATSRAGAIDAEIAGIGSESRAFLAAAPPAPAVEPYTPRSREKILADLRAAAADSGRDEICHHAWVGTSQIG